MKATYYLVTAAAVAAAAVTVYAQLPNLNPPLPKTVGATRAPSEVPRLALPPITSPPDEPFVMPGLPAMPGVPALPPVSPVSGREPVIPSVPPTVAVPPPLPTLPVPALPPAYTGPGPVGLDPPTEPLVPPPAIPLPLSVPAPGGLVPPPALPVPTPKAPVEPLILPQPTPAPKPLPLPPPKPLPLPPVLQPPVQPVPGNTAQSETHVSGKYVVLKDDKVIEGAVTLRGDVVVVRHGALDRPYTKSQIQFVAESKDEVYKFMLAKVHATDVAARLQVARWCMFSGMREQALTETREVQKLQPGNKDAAALARSLELSLQQFPPENSPKMSAPAAPTFPTELRTAPPVPPTPAEPELDVTPEAANLFATRVQPFLANQCVECHTKPDAGKFKLVRVAPGEVAQQATRANLRAVAGQLRKDEPVSSPFLVKALAAHGGQKLPSVASRQAPAYQTIEAWTALAVGTPIMGTPAVPPPPPMLTPAVPVIPPPPPFIPVLPPAVDVVPVLPPVAAPPVVPVVDPLPPINPLPVVDPLLPPVNVALPVFPPLPMTPTPAAPVPPIPPADPLLPVSPATTPSPKPVVPPIPSASEQTPAPLPLAPLPPVKPASGTQFGTTLPPKPPVGGPTGGDEFDPAGFNQPRK